jgi:hypothetical protein
MLLPGNANVSLTKLRTLKPVVDSRASGGYKPPPHHKLLEAVMKRFREDWKVEARVHLSRNGAEMAAGLLVGAAAGPSFQWCLGLATSTARRRGLTAFAGVLGAGPVVIDCLNCRPFDEDFDLAREAEDVRDWWAAAVGDGIKEYERLSALPLGYAGAGQLAFKTSQTEFQAPGYGKEVVLPVSMIGRILAGYSKRPDQTAWGLLESAGEVLAGQKSGTPLLFDRLLRAYQLVAGYRPAGTRAKNSG